MPVARLESRALVAVTGPDARAFLNNLLTQEVETLAPGELRYAALLGPQGRLLLDLFVWGQEDGVLLDGAADRREALIQRLNLYRLRAEVRIAPDDREVFVSWNNAAPGAVDDPRLAGLGQRGLGKHSADAPETDWRSHLLRQGVPDTADFRLDEDYAIACNLDLLNAIDFHKGCFIGQEVTSRMKRRAQIKSRLVPVAFEGPPHAYGSKVLNGDLRAGEIRSGEPGCAMAMMRLDRLSHDLSCEGRPVRIAAPSWLSLAG